MAAGTARVNDSAQRHQSHKSGNAAMNLEQRLSDLEDALVERKREGAKPEELRRTIVGFANSVVDGYPGILFIGVDDKTGEVIGVNGAPAIAKKLQSYCDDDAYPSIDHQVHILSIAGKNVVALVVPSSGKRPHFAGAAYVRDGARSRRASEEQYEQLIASRNSTAGALQRLGKVTLSIIAINKALGRPGHLENGYREEAEGRIEHVDGQTVTFYIFASGRVASESLKDITIGKDDAKHRPVVVTEVPFRR